MTARAVARVIAVRRLVSMGRLSLWEILVCGDRRAMGSCGMSMRARTAHGDLGAGASGLEPMGRLGRMETYINSMRSHKA